MRRTPVILLVLLVTLSTLPAAFAQTSKKPDPLRARLEQMAKTFADAYNRGDFKTTVSFYAEDAIVFPPDSDVVTGLPAIEAFWRGARDSGMKSFQLETLDAQSSGNLAVETGKALVQVQPEGQAPSAQTVKYIVVWKKQKDGNWKIIRDIWNSMAAAPAAAATPAMEATPAMATTPATSPTPHH
jgi:ketosteroid isomerase-like protein